jgi:hypothetical protein
MTNQRIDLMKATVVEKKIDALASRQFASIMLLGNAFFTTTCGSLGQFFLKNFKLSLRCCFHGTVLNAFGPKVEKNKAVPFFERTIKITSNFHFYHASAVRFTLLSSNA